MIHIHAAYRNTRTDYIFDYVFRNRLGLEYSYASGSTIESTGIHIHYGTEKGPGIHIVPDGALISGTLPEYKENYCFPFDSYTENKESFPDIFSAVFYHISRAEEYRSERDQHNRYSHTSSVLFKRDLLATAPLDQWTNRLASYLITKHGLNENSLKKNRSYTVPTIDIDSVFAYRGRGAFRQLASLSKDVFTGNISELKKRFSVLSGSEPDPNDNFDIQQKILGENKAKYFVQVGPYGKYDKNVDRRHPAFIRIIRELIDNGHSIGLHPSYASDSDPLKIVKEKLWLEQICRIEIKSSRQHFLKFRLPQTYRCLIEIGMKEDHSMGYSEINGFRAGTAFSFPWYDLESDTVTDLIIHPFSVMDVAYKQFLRSDVQSTFDKSAEIMKVCKENNAPFVFVFHNESLSRHRGWENWDLVFKKWIYG